MYIFCERWFGFHPAGFHTCRVCSWADMDTVADKLSTQINERKFILSIAGQPKEAAVRFVNATLCIRKVAQRVLCVQSNHSRNTTVHSTHSAQLVKPHCSHELLFHTTREDWGRGREVLPEMQTTPGSAFFTKTCSPVLKRSKNVNDAVVWLLCKLALWESKIEQIYANNRLREITCKQQRQPGQQFRPSLVKKIFPSVTKSISYTSASPW